MGSSGARGFDVGGVADSEAPLAYWDWGELLIPCWRVSCNVRMVVGTWRRGDFCRFK